MTVGRTAREDRSPAVRAALARLSPGERLAQLTSAVAPTGRWEGPGPAPGVLLVPTAALGAEVPVAPAGPGVPPLLLAVGPHPGPHALPPTAAAATWDVDLVERLAHRAAAELRRAGLHGHLLPVGAGVPADPARGAVEPALAADVLAAHVRGTQGVPDRRDDPLGPDRALAVVAPLGPWPDAQWHERTLRAEVLRPLEAAVRAGAAVVVPAPAANAGVPAHTDAWLLRDVLRRDWGFDGVVLAHPGALDDLVARYRVARSGDEAVALAVEAGVDVVGASPGSARQLAELVAGGALAGWLVDDAVAAVLTLKARLGLLAEPGPAPPAPGDTLTGLALARSSVLLSDPSGALPLPAGGSVHVVDEGPAGTDGPARRLVAALAAVPGVAVAHRSAPDLTAPADTTVLLTGRPDAEAARRAGAVVAAGGSCVVVVTAERPVALRALVASTACVLLCWRDPTVEAGALVALLTGAVEPAGRLPLGPGGRPDPRAEPSIPTGHGMGGTTFGYARLVVSPPVLDGGDRLRVRCSVTNTGDRDGREVVQVYLDDPVGRTVHVPGPVLAGFEAVEVRAGRTVTVTVTLPLDRLAVWDRTMRRRVEPGTVDVLVGRSTTDIRLRATVRVAAHPSHWRADR